MTIGMIGDTTIMEKEETIERKEEEEEGEEIGEVKIVETITTEETMTEEETITKGKEKEAAKMRDMQKNLAQLRSMKSERRISSTICEPKQKIGPRCFEFINCFLFYLSIHLSNSKALLTKSLLSTIECLEFRRSRV